jgi:NAD(P)-dependent dehydrogenase (short-subunit alcohol dehydrogenase family)
MEDIGGFVQTQFSNLLYCIKAILDHMIEHGGGWILIISSDAGKVPTPGETGPGSAAAGLLMASRTLFSLWNISVNTVCISVIADTEAMDWITEILAGSVIEAVLDRQAFTVEKDDIGEAVAQLATTDGFEPMTGQVISINGGVSFQ